MPSICFRKGFPFVVILSPDTQSPGVFLLRTFSLWTFVVLEFLERIRVSGGQSQSDDVCMLDTLLDIRYPIEFLEGIRVS